MRIAQYVALLFLSAGVCATAQDPAAGEPTAVLNVLPQSTSVASLKFSSPSPVVDLDGTPTDWGRFDCSEDGSIYTVIDGYALNSGANPNGRLALVAIHPDGSVTSFPWRTIPGFTNISLPKSIFVGNGHVYVLVNGDRESAANNRILRYALVLMFDARGSLVGTVVLKQDLDPLVLGVFASGNIVLVSEDLLNNRMALSVVGADGTPIRELGLNENDFVARAAQLPAALGTTSSYSPELLIAMSKFFPLGNNLLLVPFETSGLPVIELGELGLTHSVIPRLPDKMIIDGFVSATPSTFKVRLGDVVETTKGAYDSQNKRTAVGTRPTNRIAELSFNDGSLIREIRIGSTQVQPVCETDGTFRFLTSSEVKGNLQVITARIQ
jgi:hypothetical protein